MESSLANLSSPELVELWRQGSQDAACILLARYEVRLIALVATRLNRKYRGGIAPEEVVQSAMGSFFRVTRAGASASLKLESTASAWNILATFARRKLSRALERQMAAKRGGGLKKLSLNELPFDLTAMPNLSEVDETLADLKAILDQDQNRLLELLLQNSSQKEIAEQLGIDVRTVRRRVTAIREVVNGRLTTVEEQPDLQSESIIASIQLPKICYREFVLGKLVGRGALGKVYRATLQSDAKIVAVKFMHRELWTRSESRLSFLQEIDNASRIDSPAVVKYFGWGQSPHGGPYLVSEFVDGRSLSRCKPPDASMAVRWLAEICQAVLAMHQAGVVHGDLTPNNILLEHSGRIVITDFGFAKHLREPFAKTEFADQLGTNSFASSGGTLGFAAPEQISSAFGRQGFATDIYAVGGIAYYLLTGQCPHDGGALLDTIADADVLVPNPSGSRAAAKLSCVAQMALKKAINQRPQSIVRLAEILAQ